ncbi:hypothetical protein RHMOL_Rhmol01G0269600 [Rhododendron molle]|uniref:Uncharacterized protein n=1 Tax=Rhododendron molle TaxID=49168 RepID=A0ACC0Q682_RHOML|nr:hypothetical protein RHMOL_Rhmol01G0269600 [Rhododendron molle]
MQGSGPEIDDEPLMGEFDRKEPSLVEATGNAVPSCGYNAKKKKNDPPPGHPSGPLKANPANLEVSSKKSTNRQSSGQIPAGGRGGSRPRTIIVSPSECWRRWDGSLSMELMETRDGYHYFKYVQASSYTQAQRAFQAAEATNDLDGIASILLHHPYHLDSLRAMALW